MMHSRVPPGAAAMTYTSPALEASLAARRAAAAAAVARLEWAHQRRAEVEELAGSAAAAAADYRLRASLEPVQLLEANGLMAAPAMGPPSARAIGSPASSTGGSSSWPRSSPAGDDGTPSGAMPDLRAVAPRPSHRQPQFHGGERDQHRRAADGMRPADGVPLIN